MRDPLATALWAGYTLAMGAIVLGLALMVLGLTGCANGGPPDGDLLGPLSLPIGVFIPW